MTFLEAINAVLRRLREDEVVSTNSSDYSKLIGDFVNQAIHECEHAWEWNMLQQDRLVIVSSGQDDYGFGQGNPKILQAMNSTKNWIMRVIPDDYQYRTEHDGTNITGSPYYYSFKGKKDTTKNQIIVYPTPTATENLYFLVVEYTDEYNTDGTDDSEVIKIPSLPVVLNAYAKAVLERGEDGGNTYLTSDMQARTALADEIANDAGKNHPSQVNWNVA